jgi:hypothetical protein
MCFGFLLHVLSEYCRIARRFERGMLKYTYVGLHVKYPFPRQILMKLEFSRHTRIF